MPDRDAGNLGNQGTVRQRVVEVTQLSVKDIRVSVLAKILVNQIVVAAGEDGINWIFLVVGI